VKIRLTGPARKDFKALQPNLRRQLEKQFRFLLEDLRHPSLQAKKYPEGGEGVWQGRVNRDYRFYFLIEGETYVVLGIVSHPK
jgi:mRNA-degrading endonuclease RelE of RelBE toxin-antitoxin system